MSKAYNVLNMLLLLRSRGKMQIQELAEILDVSSRMVREYKKELESFYIDIRSQRGKDGGYYLGEFDDSKLSLGFNEQDLVLLRIAETYLKQEGFMYMDEYERILDKVNSKLKNRSEGIDIGSLVLQAKPDIDEQEERKKYDIIQEGIVRSKKLRMG